MTRIQLLLAKLSFLLLEFTLVTTLVLRGFHKYLKFAIMGELIGVIKIYY